MVQLNSLTSSVLHLKTKAWWVQISVFFFCFTKLVVILDLWYYYELGLKPSVFFNEYLFRIVNQTTWCSCLIHVVGQIHNWELFVFVY